MKVCSYFVAWLSVCHFAWWSIFGLVVFVVVDQYWTLFGSALSDVGGRREIVLFSLICNNSFSHFGHAPPQHSNQIISFTHHVSLFIHVSYFSNSCILYTICIIFTFTNIFPSNVLFFKEYDQRAPTSTTKSATTTTILPDCGK